LNKVLAILALVGLTLVIAVAAVPTFLDWDRYAPEFEQRISRMTGQPVSIGGSVELRLLPRPVLEATALTVGHGPRATTAERVRADLAPWPLLRGELEPRAMTIVRPVFHVDVDRVAMDQMAAAVDDGGLPGTWTDVAIRGGAVHLLAGEEKIETLRAINLDLSRGEGGGALDARGDFQIRERPVTVSVEIGSSVDGDAPVDVRLRLPASDTSGSLYGRLRTQDGAAEFAGSTKIAAPDLRGFAAHFDRTETGAAERSQADPAHPFQFEAGVEAAGGKVELREASLDVAGVLARGSAVLSRTGSGVDADLELRVGRLDLDRILGESGIDPETWPAMVRLPQAVGLSGSLDMAAEAVLFRDGVVRNARLRASAGDGGLVIERLSGDLPGTTRLTVAGSVQPLQEAMAFSLELETEAQSLRRTLNWLGYPLPEIPVNLLRSASLRATVASDGATLTVSGIDATLDGSALGGGLSVSLGERTAVAASAVVDRADLDDYFPALAEAGLRRAASELAADGHLRRMAEQLAHFDANVQIRVEQARVGGVQVQGFALDGLLFQGRLDLRELGYELAHGTRSRISGRLADLDEKPSGTLGFRAEIDDVGETLPDLPPPLRAIFAPSGALAVEGALSGTLSDLRLSGAITSDLRRTGIEAEIRDAPASPRYRATVEISDGGPAPASPGQRVLSFLLEGGKEAATLSDIRLEQGGSILTGGAAAEWTGERPVLRATLNAARLDLPALGLIPSRAAGHGLPRQMLAIARWAARLDPPAVEAITSFDAEASVAVASAALSEETRLQGLEVSASLENGVLDLRRFEGRYAGGRVAAAARLSARGDPVLSGTVRIEGAETDALELSSDALSLSGGTFDLAVEFAAAGAPATSGLRGEGVTEVRNGSLTLPALAGFGGAAAAGDERASLDYRSLKARVSVAENSISIADVSLEAEHATAEGVFDLDLSARRLQGELRFSDEGGRDAVVQVRGPLDDPYAFRVLSSAP